MQKVNLMQKPSRLMAHAKAMVELAKVRQAVADYMGSEGCGCCQKTFEHDAHTAALGKLLKVKKYSDGSGYDFRRHRTGFKV